MNKASRGGKIPAKLFQILKDNAVKVLHSICQQSWKIQQWAQDWKRCFHSNPKEGQYQKMFSFDVLSNFSCVRLFVTQTHLSRNSPGNNTGVGCHALLHGIRLKQGLNPCLLWLRHCTQIIYCWATMEAEKCSNYYAIVLLSHASKVMLKILYAWLQHYMTEKFQMYKLGFKEAEEPEIKLPTFFIPWKTKGVPENHLLLPHWLHESLWLCESKQTVENS